MADEQQTANKSGIIVRADFGQGVDQSADYWRSPPGSMGLIRNGRLDRIGNIRKRYGYQATTAAGGSPGAPISAWAADGATTVIDAVRDTAADTWLRAGVSRRIMDESGYVARSYAPAAADPWRTIGPASDVIGDVRMLDGNLGTVDDTIDLCADDTLGVMFLVTVTKNVAAAGNTTITLTQYDRTTGTVLSVTPVSVFGETHLYPKIMIEPGKGSIVVATCRRTLAGIPGTATIDFRLFNYTASTTSFVGLIAPTATQQAVDYYDTSIFNNLAGQATSQSIYRPHCPFDVVKLSSTNEFVLAVYNSAIPGIALQRFAIDTATITAGVSNFYKPAGTGALIALSICAVTNTNPDDTIGLVGIVATIPATNANGQLVLVPFNAATLATRSARVLSTHFSLSKLYAGRLTCVQNKVADATEARFVGFVELLEAAGGKVYAHRTARVGMSVTNALPADILSYFSSSTPTTRAFSLASYYSTTTSTGALPVRLGMAVGASTADPVSTSGVGVDNFTINANYPPSAGTLVVAGTQTGCLSCIGTPNLTRVPTMVPQAPPNWTIVGGLVSLPHLVSTDSAGGFGMGLYQLTKRASGDADGGVWATMPIVAGGVVQQVDGERMAEATLADRPKLAAVDLTNAGAVNTMIAGSYVLQAVAVYRDSRGLVHRSTPSDPYRLTVTTTYQTWTVYVSTQQFTNRDDAAIEIYVTEPNGTVPRLWTTVANQLNTGGYLSIAFYDSAAAVPAGSIADLPSLQNPALYTAGGALPYVPVPSARFAFTHRNRLVVGGADDARNVYYSTEGVAYRGASFALGQTLRLEEPGGCTAATTLNDKIVMFSAANCYVVFGQFPDATGAGNALAGPENLHDQLGCTSPTSMMSIGSRLLWWASDRRIWLMDAQLAVQPAGLRVQDLTSAATLCAASIHVKDQREVRWYFSGIAEGTHCVVYNYNVDQWSTDTIKVANLFAPLTAACVSDQLGPFIANGNGWAHEVAGTWKDDANWVQLVAITNWIEPGGTQDYARMRYCQLLARWKSAHDLILAVWTDFNDGTAIGVTFPNASLLPISGTVYPEQVKFQIANQKTQAVKIGIADSDPGGITSGQGPELVGLALDLLPLGGVRRLPVSRKG